MVEEPGAGAYGLLRYQQDGMLVITFDEADGGAVGPARGVTGGHIGRHGRRPGALPAHCPGQQAGPPL